MEQAASNKPLRQQMPLVAAWIDELRAAFGAEEINAAIRAGINGQPTFYAEENGRQIGTKDAVAPESVFPVSELQIGHWKRPESRKGGLA